MHFEVRGCDNGYNINFQFWIVFLLLSLIHLIWIDGTCVVKGMTVFNNDVRLLLRLYIIWIACKLVSNGGARPCFKLLGEQRHNLITNDIVMLLMKTIKLPTCFKVANDVSCHPT